jgi:hypothetical protein
MTILRLLVSRAKLSLPKNPPNDRPPSADQTFVGLEVFMNVSAVSSGSPAPAQTRATIGIEMQKKQIELMKTLGQAEANLMASAGIGQNINTTA